MAMRTFMRVAADRFSLSFLSVIRFGAAQHLIFSSWKIRNWLCNIILEEKVFGSLASVFLCTWENGTREDVEEALKIMCPCYGKECLIPQQFL